MGGSGGVWRGACETKLSTKCSSPPAPSNPLDASALTESIANLLSKSADKYKIKMASVKIETEIDVRAFLSTWAKFLKMTNFHQILCQYVNQPTWDCE